MDVPQSYLLVCSTRLCNLDIFQGVIGEIPTATRPYHPFNLLNLPAGIVPTTTVTEQDDLNMKSMPDNDLVCFEIFLIKIKAKFDM